MEIRIPNLRHFDLPDLLRSIPDDEYVPGLSSTADGQDFDTHAFSVYKPEFDGNKNFVECTLGDFEDQRAFYLNLVRDLGLIVVITVRGKRRWIVEPGEQVLAYLAARVGLPERAFLRAASAGAFARRTRRSLRKKMQQKIAVTEAQLRFLEGAHEEAIEEMKFEIEQQEMELRHLRQELARFGAE